MTCPRFPISGNMKNSLQEIGRSAVCAQCAIQYETRGVFVVQPLIQYQPSCVCVRTMCDMWNIRCIIQIHGYHNYEWQAKYMNGWNVMMIIVYSCFCWMAQLNKKNCYVHMHTAQASSKYVKYVWSKDRSATMKLLQGRIKFGYTYCRKGGFWVSFGVWL